MILHESCGKVGSCHPITEASAHNAGAFLFLYGYDYGYDYDYELLYTLHSKLYTK